MDYWLSTDSLQNFFFFTKFADDVTEEMFWPENKNEKKKKKSRKLMAGKPELNPIWTICLCY